MGAHSPILLAHLHPDCYTPTGSLCVPARLMVVRKILVCEIEMDHMLFLFFIFIFWGGDSLMGSIQANNRAESICSPLPRSVLTFFCPST